MNTLKKRLIACAATLVAATGVAQAQTAIPASFAHLKTDLDTSSPGFIVRLTEANLGSGELPNSLIRTENQLAGFLIDPATGQPYANDADFSAVTLNPDGTYSETVAIDYGGAGALTFPGIPGANGNVSNIAMEVLTELDLDPGTYSMIVNSDDGFRVSVGPDARDKVNAIVLGEYDGGRGAGDTQFKFTISQAGAYSFRLIYEQGGGGYNCSWYCAPDNAPDPHILVNADGGIKAYQKLTTATGPYVDYLLPLPDAVQISPGVVIKARVKDGSTTVVQNSVKLYFDAAVVAATVTQDANGTLVTYDPPGILQVLTKHSVALVFTDSGSTTRSNAWSFTVANFGNIDLPTPIVYEDFESVDEGSLPAGWTLQNFSNGPVGVLDLDDPNSDSYMDWVVITDQRVLSIGAAGHWDGNLRLSHPDEFVNGVAISGIVSNKFIYAESDQRGGSQVQYVFTKDYDMTGHDHLYVSYYSMYEQNQDSIGSVEYSIDGGTTWLPIVYMIDKVDIVYQADGTTIDGYATMNAEQGDTASLTDPNTGDEIGHHYGAFIGVTSNLWSTLGPYISGRVNDDGLESKRVELFPIPQADNQKTVRFRFAQAGTASWYFGFDNLGIYSIAQVAVAPTITSVTAAQVITVGQPLNLSVTATGTAPLTYQWSTNGVDIPGATSATYNIGAVTKANAGTYTITVRNAKGADQKNVVVTVLAGDADLKTGLVVHLAFDGDYTDNSGHNNNASAVGTPDFQNGKLGKALHVKSTTDGTVANYATLGYPADLKFADAADFTVSMWVNITSQTDDHPFISNKDWNSSNNRGWGVFSQSGGNFRVNLTGTGGTKFSVTPTITANLKDGQWHNVVVSAKRTGTVDSYIDGSLVNSTPQLTTGNIDTDDLSFKVNIGQDGTGHYTDGGSSSIEALIDDVGIWRRALTADDIGAIFLRGNAGIDVGTDPLAVGLVAHLPFEDNYNDTSGRGNNASAAGTPDFQAGKIGKALHVKSTTDGSVANYATFGYPDDLKFIDTVDFSISMWVNVTSQTDDHPFISNKDWNSSNNKGWGIFTQSGGNLRDQVTGPTTAGKFSVNPAVNWKDNAWHNIVVTFKRNVESVAYFDGSPVLTSPLLTVGSIDTDDLGFAVNIGQDGTGHYTDGGSSSIDALIDDVAIWRRIVTPDEVGKIFLRGKSGQDLLGNGGTTTGPTFSVFTLSGGQLHITAVGTSGTAKLQTRSSFDAGTQWQDVGPISGNMDIPSTTGTAFYRIVNP